VQFFSLSPFFASLLQFSFENGHHSKKLKTYFPALPPNAIAKIYRARCARLRLLMNYGIPEDIHWLIETRFDYQVSPSILSFHTCLEQVKALLQRNIVQND
jgi:hypothetical protein